MTSPDSFGKTAGVAMKGRRFSCRSKVSYMPGKVSFIFILK